MTATAEASTARDHLKAAEAEVAPEILTALRQAAQTTKTAWGTCDNCKHRVQVHIQDAQAAIAASKAFMDYTGGKPGTADGEQNTGITIIRQVEHDAAPDPYPQALEGHPQGLAHAPAGDAGA